MTKVTFNEPDQFIATIMVDDYRLWTGVVPATLYQKDGLIHVDVHADIETPISPVSGDIWIELATTSGELILHYAMQPARSMLRGNCLICSAANNETKEKNVNEEDLKIAESVQRATSDLNAIIQEANKAGLKVEISTQTLNRVGMAPIELVSAATSRVYTPRKETPAWDGDRG